MSFSSDRSLARIHSQSSCHPGTIGSHAGIHPHIYNSDNPGANTDIIRVDTSPRTVWKSPPHRPIFCSAMVRMLTQLHLGRI